MSFNMLYADNDRLKPALHLSVPDGLSSNSVTCFLEDSRGYLWIGTFNGLNRYDGYQIKKYENTSNKKILSSNRIRSLHEDSNGIIWIGTDDGISIYNYLNEQFIVVYSNKLLNKLDKGPGVLKIIENTEKSRIYCVTWQEGVLVFDLNTNFLKKLNTSIPLLDKSIQLNDIALIDTDNVLLASSKGLIHLNLVNEKFNFITDVDISECTNIKKVGNDQFLITLKAGIAIIVGNLNDNYFQYTKSYVGLQSYRFSAVDIDEFNTLWLGDFGKGVLQIDNLYNLIDNKPYKISFFNFERDQCRVRSIISTKNKGCWVGTFDKGAFKFNLKSNPLNIREQIVDENFNSNLYRYSNFVKLDEQRVYFVSFAGRVDVINTKTFNKEKAEIDFLGISEDNVVDVLIDKNNNTWIWFDNGKLFRVSANKQQVNEIKHEIISNLKDFRSLKEDPSGNIWIQSANELLKLSFNAQYQLTNCEVLNENLFFKKDKLYFIKRVYFDPSHDYLWIGTIHDGLLRVDLQSKTELKDFKVHQFKNNENDDTSLSNDHVTDIKRDKNDVLWIGTDGGGICKVIEKDNTIQFKSFTAQQGLSNNSIQDILLDDSILWILTNYGLNKFDSETLSVNKFYKEDGLPFDEFREVNTIFNNTLLFAGDKGCFFLNKNELLFDKPIPQLSFDNLKVLNKYMSPGDTLNHRVLLDKNLNEVEELKLRYYENVFSIDITSLHFSNPQKYDIKYQLLPDNEEWVSVPSNEKTINYSGLQPGKYILRAKASNSFNKWTDVEELNITIRPPWWNTTLAWILYTCLVVLFVYGIIKYRLQFLRLNHDLEIEQLEKNKSKEISDAKLRYFSSISHEIKTPIALISGPVSLLSEKFSKQKEVSNSLQLVKRQTKKIIQLINQVNDFQKAEANALKLNKSHFYFDDFIKELAKDYQFMALEHHKHVKIHGNERLYVFADKDKLEKIINNPLSNAFKFTEKDDSVLINYKSDQNNLIITITDTGKGVTQQDLPHIFERFYQSENSPNVGGSGIGLAFSKRLTEMHYGAIKAESELGKGTTIEIKLPIIQSITHNTTFEAEVLALEDQKNNIEVIKKDYEINDLTVNKEFLGSHIYLAEDNDDMRKFIATALSPYFKVSTFSNGKECITAIENEWPDLVISDVLMPELNGFELCRYLKSDMKTSHIPIILLTACSDLDEKLKGLMSGADSYITKPFEIKYIISKIESILQNRKQLHARFEINLPFSYKNDDGFNNDKTFLSKLYELMDENLDNVNVDINSFAKQLFLSRTHFYQKVKTLSGKTPYNLLKSYRIKRASILLVQKGMSVNEAFLNTGFKNRTHFNKAFKSEFKMSPSDYVSNESKKSN